MLLRKIWPHFRSRIPTSLYPLLSIPYRLNAKLTIWNMSREDKKFLSKNPDMVAPPAKLRFKTCGDSSLEMFIKSGPPIVDTLEHSLKLANLSFTGAKSVLDFGCGCGRVLFGFKNKYNHLKLFGSDVDKELADWCKKNINWADVRANDPLPPLPYPDSYFDVVWTVSVFTHLNEKMQFAWLQELQRVIKPNGALLSTVHGPNCWEGLPEETVSRIQSEGFLFLNIGADNWLHPEWYQSAYHTENYIRKNWSNHFDIIAHLPKGMHGYQDLVVLKSRPDKK